MIFILALTYNFYRSDPLRNNRGIHLIDTNIYGDKCLTLKRRVL